MYTIVRELTNRVENRAVYIDGMVRYPVVNDRSYGAITVRYGDDVEVVIDLIYNVAYIVRDGHVIARSVEVVNWLTMGKPFSA